MSSSKIYLRKISPYSYIGIVLILVIFMITLVTWKQRLFIFLLFSVYVFYEKKREVIYDRLNKVIIIGRFFGENKIINLSSVNRIIYYIVAIPSIDNHVQLIADNQTVRLISVNNKELIIIFNDIYANTNLQEISWNLEMKNFSPFKQSNFGKLL